MDDREDYVCLILFAELSNRDAVVTFTGTHIGNRTNDDVDILLVIDSEIEFIPEEIYTTFPNVREIEFDYAGLQVIDPLPELANLRYFTIFGNNIPTVRNNTFANVGRTLLMLELVLNNHETIEVDAFAGLENVALLHLNYNHLFYPTLGTFNSLSNMLSIDFEGNNFQMIDEHLFVNNQFLALMFAERNGIYRISPSFRANFNNGYIFVFFAYGNDCIDRGFILEDEVVEAFMNSALQTCYGNFIQRDPNATRIVTFEYRGSLRLFDEFGNIILSAN